MREGKRERGSEEEGEGASGAGTACWRVVDGYSCEVVGRSLPEAGGAEETGKVGEAAP